MNNIIGFLQSRRSVTAKNMKDQNFNDEDLNTILNCGIRVPDHGALNPSMPDFDHPQQTLQLVGSPYHLLQ